MRSQDALVKKIERIVLHLPFHERCAQTMEIYGPGWSIVELCRVTTASGVVGVGETIQGYTWGRSGDEQFRKVEGQNLFGCLWDDSLGAGLQMALFDAAGKLLDVPCHRLLGRQYRPACPVSWWAQSMSPEGWAAEARQAEQQGFTTMKAKARPWFDVEAQLEAVSQAASPAFRLDLDFNGLLLGVDLAAPFLGRLEEKYPLLAIVESPLPQDDLTGNALLRRKIRSPIAMHLGTPPAMTAIREEICDGFVLSGGVRRVLEDGILCAQARMPCWLQLVGTGLTTLFAVHLAAVLEAARWPAISCINIYSHPLLKEFKVEGGMVAVPEAPGLGVELDWEAVERFRVAPDFAKKPRRQIHAIHWPDGRTSWYPNGAYRADFLAGRLSGFLPGISLEVRMDDGSAAFDQEYRERFGGST